MARNSQPHPATSYPPAKDETVVSAKIHPAIGIARVGDSDEWFIGPEVTDPLPKAPGFYRDSMGRLKRQAALFRIYGYNAGGDVVRELTAASAAICWHVHVANRKAAWYQWRVALDIPEAVGISLLPRNPDVQGSDRDKLMIDGKECSISGTNMHGPEHEFRGKFMDTDVYLGELRTDEAGRLRFLGGHGESDSPQGTPIIGPVNGYLNADGWYDDVCDGPVTAEVTIEGRKIPLEGAWVVTAPPNYAPGLKSVRTLYDLLFDLYVQNNWLPRPETISFRHHVYPILQRLSHVQWVNKGFAAQFGAGGPNDFEDHGYVQKLAHKCAPGEFDTYGELRCQVFNSFRNPQGADNTALPWPWLYGDAAFFSAISPRKNTAISSTQHWYLQQWAAGDFENDWKDDKTPHTIDRVPVEDQPAMLDRAALEFCLADAFHPGCEVTWPSRHLTLFLKPFRIRHASGITPGDYGVELTPDQALSPTGPLHAQGPGDLTRWLALPWQADTATCNSGYDSSYDAYLPTFWPAHVPNQVLTKKNYEVVVDKSQEWARRLAAFSDRMEWKDALPGSDDTSHMYSMVKLFGQMGILETLDGVSGHKDLPDKLLVASFGPGLPEPPRTAPARGDRPINALGDAHCFAAGIAPRSIDAKHPSEIRGEPEERP